MARKKAPRWIKWLLQKSLDAIVQIAVDELDADQDGKVEAGEVIAYIVERLITPILEEREDIRT